MTTPMMRQYEEAKQACGDAMLLFRMGDFYDLFAEDAKIAAKVLGLTLTSRDKDSPNPTAMAGFPYHQLDAYLRKLIAAGYRAAVCEQVEDPKEAKGLVRREVTRVVSAGTLTDDQLLDPREANYLAAVYVPPTDAKRKSTHDERLVGIAWAELSSGRFEAGVFAADRLDDELARIGPAEVLIREDEVQTQLDPTQSWAVMHRPAWTFAFDDALKSLCQQFEVQSLEGFGFGDEHRPAIQAAGAVLAYLKETQSGGLDHFDTLLAHHNSPSVQIDAATRRSLEITKTLRSGSRNGSLLDVLDQTVTPMGARELAGWIAAPLVDIGKIEYRLDAVEELKQNESLRDEIRSALKGVYDLARLMGRIATGRTNPRDLQYVGKTLAMLPALKAKLTARNSRYLQEIESSLNLCPELRGRLEAALADECPMAAKDGGFIREGYDADLDALRELAHGGKRWIASYQAQQMQETGIQNLKVGFNKVFGYYLEVSNAHRDRVPDSFIRKQTLKNAERYITPELKEYEEKVLAADDQAQERELALFEELRRQVHQHLQPLQMASSAIAHLDVLASLAELATRRNYVRPTLTDEPALHVDEGRHPVLDATLPQGEFVPNDIKASAEDGMVLLITGPNMAGKSTYIRQVALLTLMAQCGSFVPAKRATIGIADRIFARVGASDELSRGQSTFMVEMVETARILNTATPRSLVILDEIGRGTSTYDGLSLAWAITEHLHDQIGCRTLFATHYHELTQLSDMLRGVENLNVAVREWGDKVVFLHQIIPGGADKSYGIHVARLAGVPQSVNERAKDVLAQLESDHRDAFDRPTIAPPSGRKSNGALQLTLFGYCDHPVIDELRELKLDELRPIDALALLQELQQRALRTDDLPQASHRG
ncbi:MAG: DNA mismatch repair protein MutS [Pirellulaceae bacterium]